jgi:hypothetical protein
MIRTKREHAHHRAQLPVDGQRLLVAHKATVGNTAGGGGGARAAAGFVAGCVLSAAIECGCDDTLAFGKKHWSGARSS